MEYTKIGVSILNRGFAIEFFSEVYNAIGSKSLTDWIPIYTGPDFMTLQIFLSHFSINICYHILESQNKVISKQNKTRGLQLCPVFNFTTQWISTPRFGQNVHFIAKTWSSNGPSNGFFLNLNQCAKGCSMQNFTFLGVSHSLLFPEIEKIWSFYGQNMVPTWLFK